MTYEVTFEYESEYEFTSQNQHGARYRKSGDKQVRILKMSCRTDDAAEMKQLILIGSELRVPVRYDFEQHVAWIRIKAA